LEKVVETLDPAIEEVVREELGRALDQLKAGDKSGAAATALNGWRQMPAPVFGWDVSLMNVDTLVCVLRQAGEFQPAIQVLNEQLSSAFYRDYQYHPYFLLGTVYFAMGELQVARENFKIADRISTGRCFIDEDPAYKALAKT
jgi:tetratricopeptide (TPR) repeat protein